MVVKTGVTCDEFGDRRLRPLGEARFEGGFRRLGGEHGRGVGVGVVPGGVNRRACVASGVGESCFGYFEILDVFACGVVW